MLIGYIVTKSFLFLSGDLDGDLEGDFDDTLLP